jgi:hypothetical protein
MTAHTHRFNVNFTDEAWKTFTALAERQGRTHAEVLRRALALEVWFQQTVESGARVLVERDGSLREVLPR